MQSDSFLCILAFVLVNIIQSSDYKSVLNAFSLRPSKDIMAKLYYTSCLDGVWIKIKKVWINQNKSHDSLDRSKLRPSQTLTNHPLNFF